MKPRGASAPRISESNMRKLGKIWGVDVYFWHIVAAIVGAAVMYYLMVMFLLMGEILTS